VSVKHRCAGNFLIQVKSLPSVNATQYHTNPKPQRVARPRTDF
jgi:hypothetical protein